MRRRRALVAVAGALAVGTTVGTRAFSSATVPRRVRVSVADDADAALAVSLHTTAADDDEDDDQDEDDDGKDEDADGDTDGAEDDAVEAAASTDADETTDDGDDDGDEEEDDGRSLVVTVQNQFPNGIALTSVSLGYGDETRRVATPNDPLDPGESATATFPLEDCTTPVSVTATGAGVAVALTRTPDCEDD